MIKKILSIVGLALASAFTGQAQTVQDIFGNTDYSVTWYGIDYSHSKIVGSLGMFGGNTPVSANELRDSYYPAWNYLILDEPEKYDIAKMIWRQDVIKDVTMVKQLNAEASMDSVEVRITPYYTIREIQKFVAAYPIENKSGIGLIFIAESMSKIGAEAYYHVVFFNMSTKEVLLHERLRGTAGGLGIRNYWASSYSKVINYITEEGYKVWRRKYGSNKSVNTPNPKAPTW